jgi:chromosome segregation protein
VQIGRRLYASGDSEYLLNKSAVRLKDIRDIFMGTGAGTAAYSIIEQGRVDQILQANPTTRRMVFEEAAGISRYKARKVEAQRRLERVDQNLLRLQDIVDQLEARLTATRSQASKAVKYRELASELRELWTGLSADDYRRAETELAEGSQEANQLTDRLAATDAELSILDEQLKETDTQATELEEAVRQLDRRRSSRREEIARHESTVAHQATLLEELTAESDRLRGQRHVLRVQSGCVAEDLQTSSRRLEQFQRDFTDQQQALERRGQKIEALRLRIGEEQAAVVKKRSDLDALHRERAKTEHDLAALANRRETIDAKEQDVQSHLGALTDSLNEARQELAERRQALDDAERSAHDAQMRIDQAREERRELRGAHDQSERQLAAWREERSAKQARRQLLNDLEQRQEGIAFGVRDVLRRAAESGNPPWSLIRGHVGDLLECELDDAPLLEVALGARLQLLVIEDLAPLVEFLNHSVADVVGRIGFVEVKSPSSAGSTREIAGEEGKGADGTTDLAACAGVVGRADQLVSYSAVPGLAARLLSDTWIVETLDDALRLSAGPGRGCRFVTRQGELLNADGTLYVGTTANEGAVISRKSELRQLAIELQRLHERIGDEQRRLGELDSSLLASDGRLQQLQEDYQERMKMLAHRKSEHASQAVECGRIQAEIDAAHTEHRRLSSQ